MVKKEMVYNFTKMLCEGKKFQVSDQPNVAVKSKSVKERSLDQNITQPFELFFKIFIKCVPGLLVDIFQTRRD